MTAYTVGQKIQLNDGRIAHVRFYGTTAFQTGDWLGVELEEATGKNDGSVKGERYFACEQGYGMFLRSSAVKSILEDVPKQTPKKISNGASRPSSMHAGVNGLKKTDVANKRVSMLAATPTPAARTARLSGIRSPTKSPTKQLVSNGASSTSTSRTSTPPITAAAARRPATSTTTARPRPAIKSAVGTTGRVAPSTTGTTRTSRPSIAPGAPKTGARTSTIAPRTTAGRQLSVQAQDAQDTDDGVTSSGLPEAPSEAEGVADDEGDQAAINFAPPPPPPIPPDPVPRSRRTSSPQASVHSTRTARGTAVSSRHVEELETKIRLLERKRAEDRDIKKSLEQAQQERDKYQGIIEKLQKKYQPQQQEITDLKKALAEAQTKNTSTEDLQAENDTIIEMATLDKEMAEELADGLKSELDALRSRQEEMELELELLRDENAEYSKDMSPEERNSAGWLQLEKENERLRNALLRLRDLTQDREQELKDDLSELRSQVAGYEKAQSDLEDLRVRLATSESNAEELKQQLEAALGAEEMIEDLTERNMGLTERIDDLRGTIEDLENIKELNDELEINHIEAEKQLQEEIDFKDALLLDRDKAARLQQSSLDDADYTITKFRELVVQLQNDLQDMQASKQISETEANDLSSKSRAMIDLNMRLQTSAAKTQVKTIELELRKMDAEEASEHLSIVQLFLPDAYHAERNSVLALLRFKRINFKAGLLQTFIRERVSSFGSHGYEDFIFAGVDVLNSLTWIATMADRFTSSICTCSIEEFSKYETAQYELEPVERALNGYIDALRREDLREETMAEDLLRSIGVMEHLATIHIAESLSSHADELLARTQVMQSQLEGMSSTFTALSTLISSIMPDVPDEDEEDIHEDERSDLQALVKRTDALITHARGAKVIVGKAYRALDDYKERSLTLDPICDESFETAEIAVKRISAYCRQVGDATQSLITEEGRLDPVTAADLAACIMRPATAAFDLTGPETGPFAAVASQLRGLTDLLVDVAAIPNDLDNTIEFERNPAPWVARASLLKQQKLNVQDTETELARAKELLRERETIVKSKDAELEEQSVRIETLEARMRDASKRSARIVELEAAVQKAVEAERRAKRSFEKARGDAQSELERVREELLRANAQQKRHGSSGSVQNDAMGPGTKLALRWQEVKIAGLQSAVVFLKDENSRLRVPGVNAPSALSKATRWLYEPLVGAKSEREVKNATLQQQGRDVMLDLLRLTMASSSVDLTGLPENKLAWRPAKASSRWQVERRREEWETWKGSVSELAQSIPRRMVSSSPFDAVAPAEMMVARPLSVDLKVPGSMPD